MALTVDHSVPKEVLDGVAKVTEAMSVKYICIPEY